MSNGLKEINSGTKKNGEYHEAFMQEGMDIKKFALCLHKKLGAILLITALGAFICGGVYIMVRELVMETTWQAQSKFYLQFVNRANAEQSYNGYTWNDLLHGDPVMDKIMEAMERNRPSNLAGTDDTTFRKMVEDALEAKILSDSRLLTVFATGSSEEWTALVQSAAEEGLLRFGEEQEEIISMEINNSIPPEVVVWSDRTAQAVIGGGVFFFVVSLFAWIFAYILDDSLYVIADAEKRYPFPLLGLLIKNSDGEDRQPYADELAENTAYLLKDEQRLLFLSPDDLSFINSGDGSPQKEGSTEKGDGTGKKDGLGRSVLADKVRLIFDNIMENKALKPMWITSTLQSDPTVNSIGLILREVDGVILAVPFGKRNGKQIDRTISFLKNQDCRILGIVIIEGNEKFWKRYY